MSVTQVVYTSKRASPRSRLVALLLCIFLGVFGIHRFYVDKWGTGILYLCTEGLFGIGVLVDLIMIAVGSFTDSNGLPLTEWDGYQEKPVTTTITTYQQPQVYQQPKTYQQPPQPKGKKNVKFCTTCGSANEISAYYCNSCGAVIEKD